MPSEPFLDVWHVDAFAFPPDVFRSCLTGDDLVRAAGFRQDTDKMRSLAARAALRHLCGRYLEVEPLRLVFGTCAQGKPRLDGPLAGARLSFNLSHSGRHVLLAFARDVEIGVDVEEVSPVPDLDQLLPDITHSGEAAALAALDDPAARLQSFIALWTAKEAVLKAVGSGLGGDPRTARFVAGPGGWTFVELAGTPQAQAWTVTRVDPAPDALAHVAMRGESASPRLFRMLSSWRSENEAPRG